MKIEVQKSFEKDILKIKDQAVASKVLSVIEKLEQYNTTLDIPNLKKMVGKGNHFRIRVGDYRIGLKIENEVIILIRFMSRNDIYKYFP